MSFVLRWLFAFLLLAATYNPTQWNYLRWVQTGWTEQMPLAVLAGATTAVGTTPTGLTRGSCFWWAT